MPLTVGDADAQSARPQVLSLGRAVFLAWKEFDGKNTLIRIMRSNDGGVTLSAPTTAASTAAASDHPQLIAHGRRVWLAWNTAREGFRLIEVTR